jgi:tetratricopeptide (TPR) repeat protein
LGDLSEKAKYLNSIGRIHKDQGNYTEALKRYEAALQIAEQLGDLFDKAKYLSNIGWIYYVRRNHSEALKRYEVTLTLLTQIGLGESQEAKAMKKNIQDIKTQLK